MFSGISLSTITSIVKLLLGIASKVAKRMERKQMMDAGAAKQQKDNLKEAQDAVAKAVRTRRDARRGFRSDGLRDDYKHYRK